MVWLCRFYVTLHIGDYCRTENRPLCYPVLFRKRADFRLVLFINIERITVNAF